MLRFVVLISALLLATGCALPRSAAPPETYNLPPTGQHAGFVDSLVTASGGVLIVLQRSRCHGRCPSYEVSVDGDGRVRFNGVAFVRHIGAATDTVGLGVVDQLVTAFDEAGHPRIAQGSGVVRCDMFDLPGVVTAIRIGEVFGRVFHFEGCGDSSEQEALSRLAAEIDRLLGTQQWVSLTP